MEKIKRILIRLYGVNQTARILPRVKRLLTSYQYPASRRETRYSEKDVVLITYGDSLLQRGEKPLATLNTFLDNYLKDLVSTVHVLPFFPYTSDDGFAICDYQQVDSRLGSWNEIKILAERFHLMVDLVLNHISSKHPWFLSYLAGKPGFTDLAINMDPRTDLSRVTRPRSHSLLTQFCKIGGEDVHLWTTFSEDQIDLNFGSIDVLLRMIDVLLFYISQGATIIRLDAIAYLWKKPGTACVHLPQTHGVVRLLRQIVEQVSRDVWIITETNVPHQENISYFGNGQDEAHLVYNFTLPPLLLYTFLVGDVSLLNRWVCTLSQHPTGNTFFNFTASHDGIGVRPLEDWIGPEQLKVLLDRVTENGGLISYRSNSDGSQSPYELNITYMDALRSQGTNGQDPYLAQRFVASQAISMVLPGIPAIYMHSFLASRNWVAGVQASGQARSINRQKLNFQEIVAELEERSSLRHKVFTAICHLLKIRRTQSAFHPQIPFRVLTVSPSVFAIGRGTGNQIVVALTNITEKGLHLPSLKKELGHSCVDLLNGERLRTDGLTLNPFQSCWLIPAEG